MEATREYLLRRIGELYMKTCEDPRVDVNDILFEDLDGKFPKEIMSPMGLVMSLDELVWDISVKPQKYSYQILKVVYNFLLNVEKYFDVRIEKLMKKEKKIKNLQQLNNNIPFKAYVLHAERMVELGGFTYVSGSILELNGDREVIFNYQRKEKIVTLMLTEGSENISIEYQQNGRTIEEVFASLDELKVGIRNVK